MVVVRSDELGLPILCCVCMRCLCSVIHTGSNRDVQIVLHVTSHVGAVDCTHMLTPAVSKHQQKAHQLSCLP